MDAWRKKKNLGNCTLEILLLSCEFEHTCLQKQRSFCPSNFWASIFLYLREPDETQPLSVADKGFHCRLNMTSRELALCFSSAFHSFSWLSFLCCCIPTDCGGRFRREKGSLGPHGGRLWSSVKVCDPWTGWTYSGEAYTDEMPLGRVEGESRAAGRTAQPERVIQAEIQR